MDDSQFRQIIDSLGYSWRGYRKVRKGVKKRLDRHRANRGILSFEAYLTAIASNPAIGHEVETLMTVSISRFFRDHALWQALEGDIIPHLTASHGDSLSLWCAGSALGQEVYSFKILWHAMTSRGTPLPALHITATDSNPDYLRRAQAGIFDGTTLRGLSPMDLSRHFQRIDEGRFCAGDHLRGQITWIRHDMTRQPPPGHSFQIILLRNSLLTYCGEKRREPALTGITGSLDRGGFLIIGTHERVPPATPHLTPFRGCDWILHHRGHQTR